MVCQSGVEMQTGMSGGGGVGGFFKSMGKAMLGGESFFLNTFTAGPAGGWVSLAPSVPGDIAWFDCQPGQNLYIQSGSYLACTANVETDTKFQGAKGMFSGESLFFIRAFTQAGVGRVYYNSYGAVKQIPIQPGQTVTVDTGHLVAYTEGLQYNIGKVGGMKSLFFGGEACHALPRTRDNLGPNSKRWRTCWCLGTILPVWKLGPQILSPSGRIIKGRP